MSWSSLVDPDLCSRLCLTLAHSLWQVTLAAIAAWLVGRTLGRKRLEAQYAVHVAALVLGLGAAPVTFWALGDATAPTLAPNQQAVERLIEAAPTAAAAAPPKTVTTVPGVAATKNHATTTATPAPEPSIAPFDWPVLTRWIAAIYASGVALMIARLFVSALYTERLGWSARSIQEGPVYEAMTRLCREMSLRVVPRLAAAERTVTPRVVGLLRPVVLLPPAALMGLTPAEIEMILAHELSHIRRHDLWVNLLQRVAEAVLFFHPGAWWMSRQISTLREYCCDEAACSAVEGAGDQQRVRYASALLRAVELHRGEPAGAALAGVAASGRSPSELRRRIARLFGEPLAEPLRLSRGGLAALLAGVGLLLVAPTVADSTGSANQTLQVRLVGADGQPAAAVVVEVRGLQELESSHVQVGEYVEQRRYGVSVRADSDGLLKIDLGPDPSERLSLRITHPGYGPYWASWDSSKRPDPIPAEVVLQLDRAWSVGGVVVGEDGSPIAGARVRPRLEYKKLPGDNRQLGVGSRIVTADDGSWRFDSVPDADDGVTVSVTHPERSQVIARLARASYEVAEASPAEPLVMPEGLELRGTVNDEDGRPIAGALVRTMFHNDLREATTDARGRYVVTGCQPKMTRVVVSAPGKALELRQVRIDQEMAPLDFSLQPGGKIRVRVVDENGVGIPKARIFLQRWRGMVDYFEFDHVDEYTNDQGVWEWDEAPLDEFQADICRPGGMQLIRQKLQAREEEYVFSPAAKLSISGRVLDAQTGTPIDRYRVVRGKRGDRRAEGVFWMEREAYEGRGGEYRVSFDRSSDAALVRVEAPGYRAKASRDFRPDEGPVSYDFRLEREEPISPTILAPDGEPAAEADIVVGVAGSQISIRNGDIDPGQTYAQRLTADAAGRFEAPARDEPFQLVIIHERGFAHVISSDGPISDQIELTPWARVEGVFHVAGEPAPNVPLSLHGNAFTSSVADGPRFLVQEDVTTGPGGSYGFERVFPGKGRVGRRITMMVDDGATEVTSSSRVAAQFVAGETTRLDMGGSGRAVVGRLAPPDGHTGQVLWGFTLLDLRADLARPTTPDAPESVAGDPEKRTAWWTAWRQTREGRDWTDAYNQWRAASDVAPYLKATVDRDGSFRFEDAPPATTCCRSVTMTRESPARWRNVSVSPHQRPGVVRTSQSTSAC